MDLKTFFEKFELFADAPGAVGKMRELVLHLAVTGKLVPQDPNDERAENALRRCGVDLKRWGVTQPERRQDVPSSWAWIRFAGVGDQRLGKMLDAQKNRGESKPYLRNTNVQWMRFDLEDVKKMRVEEREEAELRLRSGDLLICEGGEPGRCAIWRDEVPEMYFQKALHRVRPCVEILSEFLALNLQIDCRNGVLSGYFTGATIKHLTGRSLSEYSIPLPPLAEQKRIVAKVDELMALCDRLEAQQQERETRHAALARASVARFADAPSPANLDFLFHKSYAIPPADLRKAILTLAVDGSLIKAESNETQFGEVVDLLGGYAFKSEWFTKTSGIRLVRNQNISHGELDWRETEYLPNDRAREFEKWALRPGDLVLSLNRPFISTGLKLAWITDADCPCLLVQRIVCLRPDPKRLLAKYLYLWCNAPQFYRDAHVAPSSGVPYIAPNRVAQMKMRLPPLAEQRRIVAKVDQLMALVDELETQLAASRATAAKLLSALVGELSNGLVRH